MSYKKITMYFVIFSVLLALSISTVSAKEVTIKAIHLNGTSTNGFVVIERDGKIVTTLKINGVATIDLPDGTYVFKFIKDGYKITQNKLNTLEGNVVYLVARPPFINDQLVPRIMQDTVIPGLPDLYLAVLVVLFVLTLIYAIAKWYSGELELSLNLELITILIILIAIPAFLYVASNPDFGRGSNVVWSEGLFGDKLVKRFHGSQLVYEFEPARLLPMKIVFQKNQQTTYTIETTATWAQMWMDIRNDKSYTTDYLVTYVAQSPFKVSDITGYGTELEGVKFFAATGTQLSRIYSLGSGKTVSRLYYIYASQTPTNGQTYTVTFYSYYYGTNGWAYDGQAILYFKYGAEQYGSVSVTVTPQIPSVDGSYLVYVKDKNGYAYGAQYTQGGQTVTIKNLLPGTYTLVVYHHPSGARKEKTITVYGGRTTSDSVVMSGLIQGTLSVYANTKNWYLYVYREGDGCYQSSMCPVSVGQNSISLNLVGNWYDLDFKKTPYEVYKVEKSGSSGYYYYAQGKHTVLVEAGKTTTIYVYFKGKIRVLASPSNCEVYIDNTYVGSTGSVGYLDFQVTSGTHTVTVKKSGYVSQSKQVYVNGGAYQELTFNLQKTYTPTPSPTPTPSLTPTPVPSPTPTTPLPTQTPVGDRDGDGIPDNLDNCPDVYDPTNTCQATTPTPSPTPTTTPFTGQAYTSVRGRVVDYSTGYPVSSASVDVCQGVISSPEQCQSVYSTTTDSSGRFEIRTDTGVFPNTYTYYTILAKKGDAYGLIRGIQMISGGDADIGDVYISSATSTASTQQEITTSVSGRVLTEAGDPVSGATISFMHPVVGTETVTTDSNGQYSLSYNVPYSMSGQKTTVQVNVNSTSGTFSGTIVVTEGTSNENADITVSEQGSSGEITPTVPSPPPSPPSTGQPSVPAQPIKIPQKGAGGTVYDNIKIIIIIAAILVISYIVWDYYKERRKYR